MPRTPDRTAAVLSLVRRRGAMPALVTALGVAAFMVAAVFVQNLVMLLGIIGQELEFDVPGMLLGGFGDWVLLTALPFGLGFFVALWLVAPIAEVLELRHVIARSVLAVGIGATLVFLVRSIVGIVRVVAFDRPIFSNSFPQLDFVGSVPSILLSSLQGSIVQFVTLLPLGVLAGVLLWLWRQKHPAEYEIAGLIDV